MKDIKYYENLGIFNDKQIREICYGLESELDILVYAKPEFNDYQMQQIRLGLENGVDVSVYAKPEFDDGQMQEIRKGLEENLDVKAYLNPKLDVDDMREIFYNLKAERYAPKLDELGIDLRAYDRLEHIWAIIDGIELGVDVSAYAKPGYEWEEIEYVADRLLREKIDSLEEKTITSGEKDFER